MVMARISFRRSQMRKTHILKIVSSGAIEHDDRDLHTRFTYYW